MLHVAEGVKLHEEPDEAHQIDKEQAQPVGGKAQGQGVAQAQERNVAAAGDHRKRGAKPGEHDGRHAESAAQVLIFRAEDKHRADNGDQNGQKDQHFITPPFT